MKKQLHPGVKWSFRIGVYFIGLFFSIGLVVASGFVLSSNIFLMSLIALVVFIIILAEVYTQMSYNRWFYEFTDSQLRLERGIIWKRYSNIPYERIQNVDITRGIVARILGFSTVNIQTAGFSYSPNKTAFSEGYIPGVSIAEAEHIREFVVKKVSKKGRNQGL